MLVCCEEVGFSLPPELSSCSVYFVFSSLLYYLLLQQSPLRCWPFFNRSTIRAGACLSNVTECHTISTAKNFLHRKPTVFGFPHTVFCSSPWQPCIAQSSISSSSSTCHFFSAIFSAQLISYPLPNFLSILALQAVENVSSKLDQELFFLFAPLFEELLPLLFRSRNWNGIRRVIRVACARRPLGLARNTCTHWRASNITKWQVTLSCSLFGA